jgi:hypothetical protein
VGRWARALPASLVKVLSRKYCRKVPSSGRHDRTMPCSSMAASIGTPVNSRTLMGSCRIGQSKPFHWANNRQRSACCS